MALNNNEEDITIFEEIQDVWPDFVRQHAWVWEDDDCEYITEKVINTELLHGKITPKDIEMAEGEKGCRSAWALTRRWPSGKVDIKFNNSVAAIDDMRDVLGIVLHEMLHVAAYYYDGTLDHENAWHDFASYINGSANCRIKVCVTGEQIEQKVRDDE